MNQIVEWLAKYSPAVALLLACGAAMLFVVKIIVEKSIASQFDAKSKLFEALLKRRSAFEEKVLSDRFALITGLCARLERVMTNINRLQSGHPTPDGFMKHNEIVPLTEIFEDINIHRLVLGEEFYELVLEQAKLTLDAANAPSLDQWGRHKDWAGVQDRIRSATEAAFGIEKIRW